MSTQSTGRCNQHKAAVESLLHLNLFDISKNLSKSSQQKALEDACVKWSQDFERGTNESRAWSCLSALGIARISATPNS